MCLELFSLFACSLLFSCFFSSLLKIVGLDKSRELGNVLRVLDIVVECLNNRSNWIFLNVNTINGIILSNMDL